MKQRSCVNIGLAEGWRFCRGKARRWQRLDHDTCYGMSKAGGEAGNMEVFLRENPWQAVTVPHDWSTAESSDPAESPDNGFKSRGEGWYWIDVPLPAYGEDAVVLLEFEGIMGESVVYVNGVLAARNASGYTGFAVDVSDYVLPGETATIVVSVDNTRWEGWWYEGAGIYRPARIRVLPPVRLRPLGVFPKTVPDGDAWTLSVRAELDNALEVPVPAEVRWTLRDGNGRRVAEFGAAAALPAMDGASAEGQARVERPDLWSPDEPNLYVLETALWADGVCVERQETSVGFREILWTDRGMFLNGRVTPVRGICCHQDHAGVGIAVGRSLTRYRIARLKAMGCNAYRCAHHCPSEYLLRVCDELGMLVMVENRHFRTSDEVMAQVDYMVRLSRSHPCVFLYSLFNEEPWQAESRGSRMAAKLRRRVHGNDDSRPVTAAMNGGVLTRTNASDALDVAGMNYFIDDYPAYAVRRPGHPMVGTENGPIYATRGVYADDSRAQVFDSYGLTTAFFGQRLPETMAAVAAAPQVAGLFVWGGFDYRGEPQPYEWPSVFSHWGLMDNCGFEKDTFYMLKSYYADAPMLHLLPHWNWAAGGTVRVCVMSNCDCAQILVNGRPLEQKAIVDNRAEWMVPYEAGTLSAIAWKGSVRLVEEVRTSSRPTALKIVDAAPSRDFDCAILNVELVDAQGVPVRLRSQEREVHVEVICGELAGVGNGDPNGTQPDICTRISTFCGRCQILIHPDGNGVVRARLSCEGLAGASYERQGAREPGEQAAGS